MKTLLVNILLMLSAFAPLSSSLFPHHAIAQTSNPKSTTFVCGEGFDPQTNKRLPTTYAWTPRGKVAVIRWETRYFPNYSPQRRCEEVSPRFQAAYQNKTINLLTNSYLNNQPVICTVEEVGGQCHTLILTLRPDDGSVRILEQLVSLVNGGGIGNQVGPVRHTNQRYYRINIQEFLDTAPVEK